MPAHNVHVRVPKLDALADGFDAVQHVGCPLLALCALAADPRVILAVGQGVQGVVEHKVFEVGWTRVVGDHVPAICYAQTWFAASIVIFFCRH